MLHISLSKQIRYRCNHQDSCIDEAAFHYRLRSGPVMFEGSKGERAKGATVSAFDNARE